MTDHTSRHVRREDGRSLEIEGYAAQGMDWMMKVASEHLPEDPVIVDMGSDYGFCLHYLKAAKYPMATCIGIDPFYQVNPFGLDLRRESMTDPLLWSKLAVDLPPHLPVDLVIFNHSLEHVTDPYLAMASLSPIMTGDTLIFVAVPDLRSEWRSWEGHYTLWDQQWLEHFMKLHRLKPIAQDTFNLRPDPNPLLEVWGLYEASGA